MTLTFPITWCHRSSNHFIPQMPFPIGVIVKQRLYLQPFSRYSAPIPRMQSRAHTQTDTQTYAASDFIFKLFSAIQSSRSPMTQCNPVVKIQPERAGTAFRHLCLAFHHLKLPYHHLKLSFYHLVLTFRHHLGKVIKTVATRRSDFNA